MTSKDLKQIIKECDAVFYASWNWERLVKMGRLLSVFELPKFFDALNNTDYKELDEEINSGCKLKPTELVDKLGEYAFILELEFVNNSKSKVNPEYLKEIERELDVKLSEVSELDLRRVAVLFRNIEFFTSDNLYMLYSIFGAGADVSYGDGTVYLEFNKVKQDIGGD